MFPEYDMSGKRLHWRLRQFLKDGSKVKVGPPRLRQVRSEQKMCKIPYVGEILCHEEYQEATEETGDFCVGWKSGPCKPDEKVYQFSSDAWKFTSALDIWGLPVVGYYTTYGGGGYITKLSVNQEVSHQIIHELYNNSWIDSQTRAVMFEFTLYSISTNIFTYNIFLAEFPVTGGVFPYAMILPIRLYMHVGSLGVYTMVCEFIYLVYLLIITVMTVAALVRQKMQFFKTPWQVYDLVYIMFSYVAIVMYFVRLVLTNKSMATFQEDKKEFVNFFHIAVWDQLYVLLLGTLVFMATLRMLNVLGYNKRINAVVRVFSNAATEIIWFGVFFLYVYICYAVFGYLLFGSKLRSYKDVYKAMGTLFISMIGKSRFSEIEATDPIFSKIYFMIFIFFVVYMILTMFLAVLTSSIDQVHKDVKRTKADEMVEYVINKFKTLLSFNRKPRKQVERIGRQPTLFSQAPDDELDSKCVLEDIRTTLIEASGNRKTGEKVHFKL